MGTDVTVLRVFTDAQEHFGNALGVVDAKAVPPADRQRLATQLGYSETVFVDLPLGDSTTAHTTIFTPASELPFAGHPTVGVSWWLRDRGMPIDTLAVPAGMIAVGRAGDLTTVRARADWSPEFVFHEPRSADEVTGADPADFDIAYQHYVWSWLDEATGHLRSRMFAPALGVVEDEATGSAAVRLTDILGRDLLITQGGGSVIQTWHSDDGWIQLGGRVVDDGTRRVD